MKPRRTLGQRLAMQIALATAGCTAVAALGGFAVWALTEPAPNRGGETMGEELLEQLVPMSAIIVAGVVVAVLATRWLTRRATARIDDVILIAGQVGAHDLSVRVPVSSVEDELDELAIALNIMLKRIESGVEAQRQFSADASHELRTPLTAAINALEVARRRPRTADEWTATAAHVIVDLARMSRVIDALLQLSRAGNQLGEREDVPVGELLDRVAGSLESRGDVTIRVDVPDELVVHADPAALEIAVSNLLANAVAHSPAGADVTVRGARADGGVQIEVSDRGPGVAAAERARIFEPFARGVAGGADRIAHGAGLGLGLPIAKRIALAHGGRLDVGDAVGGGAQFTLWLPGRDAERQRGTP